MGLFTRQIPPVLNNDKSANSGRPRLDKGGQEPEPE